MTSPTSSRTGMPATLTGENLPASERLALVARTPHFGGHPVGLYVLFLTEMWERFTFYGMRGLLVLFMTNVMERDDESANHIYGSYQALVYALPLFGGLLADQLLGHRRAIYFGGITMALGSFLLMVDRTWAFYFGLALVACGNCYFKPNISTIVGDLYPENDPRRESAFTLFYAGINIGAFGGGLLCGWIAYSKWGGWHMAFGAAGVALVLGLLIFSVGKKYLPGMGYSPNPSLLHGRGAGGLTWEWTVYLVSLLMVPVFALSLFHYQVLDYVFNPLALLALVYLVVVAFRLPTAGDRNKLLTAIVLMVFSVLFWGFYEQGGGALNLYAERNVDLNVAGTQLNPASVNNSINPLFIILLSPLFALLWPALQPRGLNPSTALKFVYGLAMLGLGFLVFVWGGQNATGGIVPLWYFALGYLFLSIGELCLSPIGLSMVTKLSPARLVGLMMGAWFLASAMGQYVAGKIGGLMSVPKGEAGETAGPVVSLPIYSDMFLYIAKVSFAAAAVLLVLYPLLKRWAGENRKAAGKID
jgi:proton-dependent oligopeptide transporter, POT family